MSSVKSSYKHFKIDEKGVMEQLKEQIKNLKKFPTEKGIRCQAFQADPAALQVFPASTKKEQLLLEWVKRYEGYFRENYDSRQLMLYPLNEAGVAKFVCSFIRPTQVSYIELFDYLECVRFVSNFMMYEELEEPKRLPETIVSPYSSIDWQIGDSADIAVLTASLLLGVGFDVFVVIGDASQEITKKNENNVACFFLGAEEFELKDEAAEPPKGQSHSSLANAMSAEDTLARKSMMERDGVPLDNKVDKARTLGRDRPLGATAMVGEKASSNGNFFSFDLTRQAETYSENGIFDQYNQVKNAEENPYYKELVKNDAKKYDEYIFRPSKTTGFGPQSSGILRENRCDEDIYFKNPNKYLFETKYEAQFKKFLRDDEPLRLKILKPRVPEETGPGPRGKPAPQSNNAFASQAVLVEKIASQNGIGGDKNLKFEVANASEEVGIHFWLLVRASGMRDVKKSVFLDPISGRSWEVDSKSLPFFSVKQMFNHRNCWIHLNERTPISQINFETFDNYRNDDWEYVLNEEAQQKEQHLDNTEEEAHLRPEKFGETVSRRLSSRRSIFTQAADNVLTDGSAKPRDAARTGKLGSGSGPAPPGLSVVQMNRMAGRIIQNQNEENGSQKPKTFAEKIISMEELFQRPSTWIPKFDIPRDRFLMRFAKNRQRKFYQKCQVDYFSRYSQTDGLVKRVQIFMDHNRLLMREVRNYYADRPDKLRVRRDFPFEFKMIEQFDSFGSVGQNNPDLNIPHWKEIETQIGRKIVFKFYPLRFHDGLIEREEIIGEKTILRFANRDDKLVYSSIRFHSLTEDPEKDPHDFNDRHLGRVNVVKMVQKYEKNQRMAGKQVAKVIIDLKRNRIKLIYHLGNQQISPEIVDISRESFTGLISRTDKKAAGDPSKQSVVQFLYSLEKECLNILKKIEATMPDSQNKIRVSSVHPPPSSERPVEEPKIEISPSTFVESADVVNPMLLKKNPEDEDDFWADDRVELELRSRGLLGQKIDQMTAEEIKRDILTDVEDRFIQRADIINKRFEEEKAKVKGMHKKIQKKAFEGTTPSEEDKTFEEELYRFNLKISILEQRLFNFQKVAFEKYAEIQTQLNNDARLNNLS